MTNIEKEIELNNIISKIMYDYETHRGMPIDSIEKYQPKIKIIISQIREEAREQVIGEIADLINSDKNVNITIDPKKLSEILTKERVRREGDK